MIDRALARQQIQRLVSKYQTVLSEKRISKYNEENTKAEFIEPLFDALGWDVRNTNHKDEVTREEKISKDRVDYSFLVLTISPTISVKANKYYIAFINKRNFIYLKTKRTKIELNLSLKKGELNDP